jgi:hypothetical protein
MIVRAKITVDNVSSMLDDDFRDMFSDALIDACHKYLEVKERPIEVSVLTWTEGDY